MYDELLSPNLCACGHAKVWHRERTSVPPLGQTYCDDRHGHSCNCKEWRPIMFNDAELGELVIKLNDYLVRKYNRRITKFNTKKIVTTNTPIVTILTAGGPVEIRDES